MAVLKAQPRTETGKKVKSLRKKGFLPAVLYGEGVESTPISVLYRDFEKVFKDAGESTLVMLEYDDNPFNVLIHDIGYDFLSGRPLHADFLAVRMDKAIRTMVSIEFVGESIAVKNLGGILVKVIQELEVEALPKDLPHNLPVDISVLKELEAKLHVSDIKVTKGVRLLAEPEKIVVLVESPRTEAEIEELAKPTEGVAEVKTVKTEQEEKREKADQDNVPEETAE